MLNLWIGVFKMESKDVKDVDLKKVFSKKFFFFFVSLLAKTGVASYTTSGLARVTIFLLFCFFAELLSHNKHSGSDSL